MVQPGVSALGKKNKTTVLPRKSFKETCFSSWSSKLKSGALSLRSMGISPLRSRLYRKIGGIVICAALLPGSMQAVFAQVARGDTKSKGPRATALLQLPANSKPRLIPVCIMIDGRFFDAGIYKADPVPMALENGTVYEAQRTGKPIGLFTVKNVLQQQQTKAWLAEGDWELAGAAPKKPTALQAESKPREEEDKPPTLRRPAKTSSENKPGETKPADNKPAEAPPPGTSAPGPAAPSSAPGNAPTATPSKTSVPVPNAAPGSTQNSSSTSAPTTQADESDPNAPRLQRGVPPKPSPLPAISKKPTKAVGSKTAVSSSSKPAVATASEPPKSTVEQIPAISDADGPEPRPYTYDMKAEEEQAFRKKMLALAGTEIARYANQFESPEESTKPSQRKRVVSAKSAQNFEDVNFRIFDVATNNEPIIVLSAKAAATQAGKPAIENGREYYITLVARADYNNELRKLLSVVTDSQHLDVAPRMELIDAVDADGDGRAELLFRENSDAGTSFVVYRVTPDRLWALFEGTPH
jgi:hypothetical protein